jgi:phosphatidylethanolamine-binding protein (PEBP) family uncharacterized protein
VGILAEADSAVAGRIDARRGPCPPPGHGAHRYFFRLYAIDAELDLAPGARKDELERLIGEHELAVAELMGTYERR